MDDTPKPTDEPEPPTAGLSAEQQFAAEQDRFEAEFRAGSDPLVLLRALTHAVSNGPTGARWILRPTTELLLAALTDQDAEDRREDIRFVQRFMLVHELRCAGRTKDEARDVAAELLRGSPAAAKRTTVAKSYDLVRADLRLMGQKSRFWPLIVLCAPRGRTGTMGTMTQLLGADTPDLTDLTRSFDRHRRD